MKTEVRKMSSRVSIVAMLVFAMICYYPLMCFATINVNTNPTHATDKLNSTIATTVTTTSAEVVTDITGVMSANFMVKYDPTIVKMTGITAGLMSNISTGDSNFGGNPTTTDAGYTGSTADGVKKAEELGLVKFGWGGLASGDPISDIGTLFTLNYTVLGTTGNSDIEIVQVDSSTPIFSDAGGSELACGTVNKGTITVTAPPDTTKPVITLTGNSTVNLANGASYTDAGATATDNVDGTITANIVTTIKNAANTAITAIDTAVAGTYTYYYNVSDAAGNAAVEVTRTVIVADPDKTTLTTAINNASMLLSSKTVGTDIGNVPQLAATTFSDAIATATGVKDSTTATQAEINAQVSALANATIAFNNAIIAPKPFTITATKDTSAAFIKVTANVTKNMSITHAVVVFQLMNGTTPVGIVSVEKDIATTEAITAMFPGYTSGTVTVMVLDALTASTTQTGNILATTQTVL